MYFPKIYEDIKFYEISTLKKKYVYILYYIQTRKLIKNTDVVPRMAYFKTTTTITTTSCHKNQLWGKSVTRKKGIRPTSPQNGMLRKREKITF